VRTDRTRALVALSLSCPQHGCKPLHHHPFPHFPSCAQQRPREKRRPVVDIRFECANGLPFSALPCALLCSAAGAWCKQLQLQLHYTVLMYIQQERGANSYSYSYTTLYTHPYPAHCSDDFDAAGGPRYVQRPDVLQTEREEDVRRGNWSHGKLTVPQLVKTRTPRRTCRP
jgi:hypothetical protein